MSERATLRGVKPVVVLTLACLLAPGALAQGRWHEQAMDVVPAGAVLHDFAFHVDEGYLTATTVPGEAGNGRVYRLRFSLVDGPTLDDTNLPAELTYNQPFVVSYNGDRAAVTTEQNAVALLDDGATDWVTSLPMPLASLGVIALELDTAGGFGMMSAPESAVGNGATSYFNGSIWTDHRTGGNEDVHVGLLAGSLGIAVDEGGRVFSTTSIDTLPQGGTWSDLGVQAVTVGDFTEDGSAVWLGAGDAVFVSQGTGGGQGSFALYVEGADATPTFADCSAEGRFRRVTTFGGVLFAQEESGAVYRTSTPSVCASWTTAAPSPTSFDLAVGVGAVDEETAVVVGNRGTAAFVAWRNRSPVVVPPAAVELSEGSSSAVAVDAIDPDTDDAALLALIDISCTGGVSAVASGLDLDVTAPSTPAQCPGVNAPESCSFVVTDGDRPAFETAMAVSVTGIDEEPPTAGDLVITRTRALPGQEVVVSLPDATDPCGLEVQWLIFPNDEPGTTTVGPFVSDTAPFALAFPAPAAAPDGSARLYTVEAVVDDGTHTVTVTGTLEVFAELSLALGECPATVLAGEAATFTITEAQDQPPPPWAFTLATEPEGFVIEPVSHGEHRVVTSVCDGGRAFRGVWQVNAGGLETTAACEEETQVLPVVTSPSLTAASPEDVIVPVGVGGAATSLIVDVTDACPDDNELRWDLSALPEALWPDGQALVIEESAAVQRSLVLSAGPEQAGALVGVVGTVTATLAGDDEPLSFTLRFVAGEDLMTTAAVDVTVSVASLRSLSPGDVAPVDALVTSSLPFALPRLRFTLADGDLAAVDGTIEVASNGCGARADAQRTEGGLVVVAEGVRAECSLSLGFLARKGLAPGSLRVERCTWGDDNGLERCTGAVVVARPRGLGCAQTESSTTGCLLLLLVLLSVSRRRCRP